MTGGINNIDTVIIPRTCGGGSGNGNAPLLFLLHPVHDRRAVIDITHPVGFTGVVQYPLCRSRFAGINVRHNADIAETI
jgi:hypothetical protein